MTRDSVFRMGCPGMPYENVHVDVPDHILSIVESLMVLLLSEGFTDVLMSGLLAQFTARALGMSGLRLRREAWRKMRIFDRPTRHQRIRQVRLWRLRFPKNLKRAQQAIILYALGVQARFIIRPSSWREPYYTRGPFLEALTVKRPYSEATV